MTTYNQRLLTESLRITLYFARMKGMENKASRETDNPEEILDLVNESDEVIGSLSRKEVYAQGLRNYRVIHAFIVNTEGKLWIPRRVSSKKLYPNGLDYSIAGHVESGETYVEGLIKEASEEVGLDLNLVPYKEIGRFNPFQNEVHCFQRVYEIQADEVPNYNREDFSGFEWLTPQEVIGRYENGEVGKEDIPEVIKLCYLG